ncbi:MAG: HlyD family secretion protein [Planctomycetia bacterium]|nr:HlyD family secretion protein [Planctomycetia bacterium]MBL6914607.1 HlyD family secretion protein [Planctomycetota bacterium]HCW45473.1 hemolysin D [Planctomycetota bacterium]
MSDKKKKSDKETDNPESVEKSTNQEGESVQPVAKEELPGAEEKKSADGDANVSGSKATLSKGVKLILALIAVSLFWNLLADRFTPYTSQARVQGFVVGVSPKVAGVVTQVFVENNEEVEIDQPLFEIDKENYEIALRKAESDLQKAESQLGAGSAGIESARANLRAAEANELKAEQDANRQERLYEQDSGSISVRRLEIARATLEQTRAMVTGAKAEVQRAIGQRGGEETDNAQVKAALSAVEKAKLDLENTTVRASSRGMITDLRADVGQFAGAGAPVMTLIAMHDVWISAEFTENNLGHLKVGSPVEIVLDSLPGQVISGTVQSIGVGVSATKPPPAGSLPSIQNNRDWLRATQRFPIVIGFDSDQIKNIYPQLRIGGQADVIAYTQGHPLLKMIGEVYIRFLSWVSYAY